LGPKERPYSITARQLVCVKPGTHKRQASGRPCDYIMYGVT